MIKKVGVLILILFFSLTITQAQSPAQRLDNFGDSILDSLNNAEDKYNNALNSFRLEQDKDYLRKDLTDSIDKSKIGKPLLLINKLPAPIKAFFSFIFGVETSPTWAFLFSIFFFLVIFFLSLKATIPTFDSKPIGIIVSLIVSTLFGLMGINDIVISGLSRGLRSFWITSLIFIVFAAVISFLLSRLGLGSKASEKEQLERSKAYTNAVGELSKKELKEMAFGGKSTAKQSIIAARKLDDLNFEKTNSLKGLAEFLLFGIFFVASIINMFIPDPIPFIDEIILWIITAYLGYKNFIS